MGPEGLGGRLARELKARGCTLVGFGDISALAPEVRDGLPIGVSVAVVYPKAVIAGIAELPTAEYYEWYGRLNEQLDALVLNGAELLRQAGFQAIAQTRERVGAGEVENHTLLPHKTVATRAGLGWIGKSALLVTKQFGSMLRLSSILTDAPLPTAQPVNESLCGDCQACTDACPAGAVSGRLWRLGVPREEIFNAVKCRQIARERSQLGFGGNATVCGRCIAVCPWTQRYLKDGGSSR